MAFFIGIDRPHVLRQAIHYCRNFGIVSAVGLYGGFIDNAPMGSAINRGLTFRMAQLLNSTTCRRCSAILSAARLTRPS